MVSSKNKTKKIKNTKYKKKKKKITSHVHCRRITENTHARAPKPQQFLLVLYSLSRAVCLLK